MGHISFDTILRHVFSTNFHSLSIKSNVSGKLLLSVNVNLSEKQEEHTKNSSQCFNSVVNITNE